MNTDVIINALIDKMRTEQDNYRKWLVAQPTEIVLSHAHDYVIRENILKALEEHDLTAPQASELFASPSALEDLTKDCKDMESRHTEDIRNCIKGRADSLVRQKEELYKSPVYPYPSDYAHEHGELHQYRLSRKANYACRAAIEDAIHNHHSMNSFESKVAVQEVAEKFGYERTFFVLAATIRTKEWDGRFSSSNKNWAKTILVFDSKSADFAVQSHPALTDTFVETARHEYLLSLPLTRDDIKAEALNILSKFQSAREPNSPNGTHYMAQISPDFLARAGTKETDRLMAMLPFRSLSFSTLEGRTGTFALISQDENRFQKLVLRKPSVRKKLQEPPAAPASSAKKKRQDQER